MSKSRNDDMKEIKFDEENVNINYFYVEIPFYTQDLASYLFVCLFLQHKDLPRIEVNRHLHSSG
jgi:hypothetical protein